MEHDDEPGFAVDDDGNKSLGGDNETPVQNNEDQNNAPINGDGDQVVLGVAETPSEPDDDNTGTHPVPYLYMPRMLPLRMIPQEWKVQERRESIASSGIT